MMELQLGTALKKLRIMCIEYLHHIENKHI